MAFLEIACQVRILAASTARAWLTPLGLGHPQLAETAVYSLNKTSTRDFIERKAKQFGFQGTVIAQMRVCAALSFAMRLRVQAD